MCKRQTMGKRKNRVGVVFSTDPDYNYEYEDEATVETLEPAKQKLTVRIDRHARGGKQVTLVMGFVGTADDLAELAKMLKSRCGVGGAAKDGEIIIQGDFRDKVTDLLRGEGYNAARGN